MLFAKLFPSWANLLLDLCPLGLLFLLLGFQVFISGGGQFFLVLRRVLGEPALCILWRTQFDFKDLPEHGQLLSRWRAVWANRVWTQKYPWKDVKLMLKVFAIRTKAALANCPQYITILPEPFELYWHLPICIDLLNFGIVILTVHRVYGLAMLTNLILKSIRTYFLPTKVHEQDPNMCRH